MSILDYPKDPCHICKGTNFEYEGNDHWRCIRCSPIPETDHKRVSRARAVIANWKIYNLWILLNNTAKDDENYKGYLDTFKEAVARAKEIERAMKSIVNNTDCLYIEHGQKLKKCNVFPQFHIEPSPELMFCHACPNNYWWEKELFTAEQKKNPELLGDEKGFKHMEV